MKNTMLKQFEQQRVIWFCMLAMSILFYTILSGCQFTKSKSVEKELRYVENSEIIGAEKEKLIGKVHEAIYEKMDRSNTGVESVNIPLVPQEGVEINLPDGRYTITGHPAGNILLYDRAGDLILRELVGSYAGVSSLTIDIAESYTLRADGGYDSINITPTTTQLLNDLSAGIWHVGIDIEPGIYKATTAYGLGYVQIFEEGKEPLLYEFLGGNLANTESVLQLKEGQIIRVTKMSQLELRK